MAHRPSDWQEVFGFSDPTPGDPWEIQQVEKTWRQVHEHARSAETTLRGLLGDDAVATWIGQAGDTFRTKSSDLPDQLGKVSESYRQAADAMGWWSGRLDTHQADADHQLQRGREALADLKAAQSKLDLAGHDVDGALKAPGMTAMAPTPEQVQHAQDQLKAAQTAQTAAQGLVDNAQARLDAARALADDAGEARRTDGKETASKIRAAADAGVPPRSRWQKIKDGLSDAWDFIVDVAKIVVAVLGVVVLIIGGPLAWIVLAAALIVLVDTIVKYAKGQATLLDVALAALGCIPGFKGLTTFKALSGAFKSGGVLAAAAHVGSAVKSAAVSLAVTVSALRKSLGPGLKAAIHVLGSDAVTVAPSLRTTLREMSTAFSTTVKENVALQHGLYNFQGVSTYPGRDPLPGGVASPGLVMEAGFPGLGNFATDSGTAAAHANDMQDVWGALQVGATESRGFRPSMLELHIQNPVNVLHGPVGANPQYGPGGASQYFLDIQGGIVNGDIQILDHAGSPIEIPDGMTVGDLPGFLHDPNGPLGGTGHIQLTGSNMPGPGVMTTDEAAQAFSHLPDSLDIPLATAEDVRHLLQGIGYVGASR